MGATLRVFNLAKAFISLGFDVALLAGKMTNETQQVDIDKQFPGIVVRTKHSGHYPGIFYHGLLSKRVCRMLWKVRSDEFYWANLSFGWGRILDLNWVLQELERRKFNPD